MEYVSYSCCICLNICWARLKRELGLLCIECWFDVSGEAIEKESSDYFSVLGGEMLHYKVGHVGLLILEP